MSHHASGFGFVAIPGLFGILSNGNFARPMKITTSNKGSWIIGNDLKFMRRFSKIIRSKASVARQNKMAWLLFSGWHCLGGLSGTEYTLLRRTFHTRH